MSTLEAKTSTAYITTGGSGPYYSVLGYGSIGLSVTGTFSAGTLKFQGSNDSVTWTDLQILQASTPVTNDEITAIGNYVCGIVSYQTARLFVSGFTGSVVATASVSPQIVLPVISGGNEVVDSLTILGQQGALAADVNGLIYSAQGVSGDVMRQSGTGAGELDSVTWTGARYIAVGASGNIYTSTTGTGTWTRRTSGTASQFLSVTWNGSLAVAVGIGGVVATSADGITWTLRTSGTANNLASVTWDGTAFIVVGSVQTVITSPDGTTWTTRTFGTTTAIRGVASTSSLAIAVCASGIIKTSTDHGVTWTSRTSGVATTIWKVAVNAGGTLWTAVGASGVILTSPDGTTWTSRTSGAGTTTIENIAFGNSLWVAVGDSGFIATSSNGTTWTVQTSGTTQALYGLVYGVAWIAVGNAIKLSSPDAVTWSVVAQNVWVASTPVGTGSLLAQDGDKTINGANTFPIPPKLSSILSSTAIRTDVNGAIEAATKNLVNFTGTLTGVVGTVTGTFQYQLLPNGRVNLLLPIAVNGTSNSTDCTITGLPAAVWPSFSRTILIPYFNDASSIQGPGILTIGTGGLITLYRAQPTVSAIAFTAAGNKGVGEFDTTYTI